ncbi:acetolactate synthase, large subunit, biosynthetic type [Tyzzerella sp. An114]|uniref:biosynthetic-type acetolactate synthase large subunit n=1 Tax=Tyzzerella sp. An114 TaxID=1965545 RepID=UPI000B4487F3|nr:biosynthetic-type acetolactate synthase large subunit [Tyzzerella sp. An114]OUQ59629.1 acetolactate synthase, large subunit, biosynthetic type [Tyzzerella sp. An114]
MDITGAELFVKALKAEDVDMIFAYPGGNVTDIFNELYKQNDIEVILPRHEQALSHAADGYARSTGKVGVCLVTSGPGATNLVTGIATANFDSVPMVCFTGQVPTHLIGNDAFQEVDIVGITRHICKYAVTVRSRDELATVIKKAFFIARSGKPGVVLVDLPKDIQMAYGSDEYPETIEIRSYKPNKSVHIGQVKKAVEVLKKSKRPVFLVGGGVNIARANEDMRKLAEKTGIPVITTIMGKGAIPTDHELYVGNIGIHGSYAANTAISRADVLFSIGTRFNDRITGKISEFAKNATIIHVDIDPASISRNIVVNIPIVADAKLAIQAITEKVGKIDTEEWLKDIRSWKEEHPLKMKAEGMTPQKIIETINKKFDNLIVTTDVGQNQLWTTQYIELSENKQLITSGGLGTMGFGFPSAIGAKLGNPDKDVIAIAGDGGAQMNIQEMATAVVYETPVIFCIFNNGYLGNVRQLQEFFCDKHYSGVCLKYRRSCDCTVARNIPKGEKCCPEYIPDFVKLAESYGAKGIRVTKEEEIEAAFDEAKKNTKTPTIIEFIIEREQDVMPMVLLGNPLSEMILEC